MIKISKFVVSPFQENTLIIHDDSKEAIIIDCGCYSPEEEANLSEFVKANDLNVKMVLNTHGHVDHVFGTKFAMEAFGVPFVSPFKDNYLVEGAQAHGKTYGVNVKQPPLPSKDVTGGETVRFGKSELQVLAVPGHTPGHVAFYSPSQKFVIVGDVLFKGSIGRTDLPGGDYDQLMKSIREQLLTLPPETTVFSGHGPETTIHEEIIDNPFLKEF